MSVSGNDASRVFQVNNGVTASISGLTITGGTPGAYGFGGGLYNKGGDLTLYECTMLGNSAEFGGGLENFSGSAYLTDCIFINNSAEFGGGLENRGTMTLADCAISANSVHASNPFDNAGGGFSNVGSAALSGCTISNNFAYGGGGGLGNQGTVSIV